MRQKGEESLFLPPEAWTASSDEGNARNLLLQNVQIVVDFLSRYGEWRFDKADLERFNKSPGRPRIHITNPHRPRDMEEGFHVWVDRSTGRKEFEGIPEGARLIKDATAWRDLNSLFDEYSSEINRLFIDPPSGISE